jgi:hypothetical protein
VPAVPDAVQAPQRVPARRRGRGGGGRRRPAGGVRAAGRRGGRARRRPAVCRRVHAQGADELRPRRRGGAPPAGVRRPRPLCAAPHQRPDGMAADSSPADFAACISLDRNRIRFAHVLTMRRSTTSRRSSTRWCRPTWAAAAAGARGSTRSIRAFQVRGSLIQCWRRVEAAEAGGGGVGVGGGGTAAETKRRRAGE